MGQRWNYYSARSMQDLVIIRKVPMSKGTQPKPSSPGKEEEEKAVKGGRGRGQGKQEQVVKEPTQRSCSAPCGLQR